MLLEESYINERLDHLGIVAGVCQEIGLTTWLDAHEPGNRQQVSVGTAMVGLPFREKSSMFSDKYQSNIMENYHDSGGAGLELHHRS